MGNFEVSCSHVTEKQIILLYHTIYVNVHNTLCKAFVIQIVSFRIFTEQSFHFTLLKVATELIETFLETFIAAFLLISQIEVRHGFFTSFPFVSFSITFESNLFVKSQFNLL